MFSLFRRLIDRVRGAPPERDVDNDFIASPAPPGEQRPRLFIAPKIDDELTDAMSRWIENAASRVREVSLYVGDAASADNLQGFVREHGRERMTLVFYGHGERDRFLTRAALGFGEECREGACRSLCTAEELSKSDAEMLVVAYCCAAARVMGKELMLRGQNAKFIGFRDDIFFSLGTPEREAAFSGPMESAVVDICSSDTIDELLHQNVAESYARERERWLHRGEFGRDTRAIFVAMYLLQHKNVLELIR